MLLVYAVSTYRDAHDARTESARLRAQLAENADTIVLRDTIYRTDTVRLWRTLAHYDSIRVTDTVTRNDTVFVPRIVADEAVASCRATVLTCEQRVAARDQRIVLLDSLNRSTERALTAAERRGRRERIVWLGAGLLTGLLWPR